MGEAQELVLPQLEAAQRLRVLHDKGVSTLICGALSAELLHYAQRLGFTVVCGVAGEIDEVVRAYWQNSLDHPKFLLPGCQGPRRYRRSFRAGNGHACEREAGPRGPGRNAGPKGQSLSKGLGPGGFCVCPECGIRVPHEQGIPCIQMRCPRCGQIMERTAREAEAP